MISIGFARAALLAALLVLATESQAQPPSDQPTAVGAPLRTEPLTILTRHGAARFTVEVAETEATREYGLMFRKSLAPDRGMLFDFHTPQAVSFWMKNTLIPLDMVFISPEGRVIGVARHATPLSETPIDSGGTVLGVLEIAGDRAAALGIQPGDRVRERIFPAP